MKLDPAAFDFQTERMHLRPLQAADEALFCELYTDADTMRFVGPPLAPEVAIKWFRRLLATAPERSALYLAMLAKASGRPLGICGVPRGAGDASWAEAGVLLRRDARSQGFAQEGMSALLERLFARSQVEEIRVEFSPVGQAVRQLMERLGFAPFAGPHAVIADRVVWSVNRRQWRTPGQARADAVVPQNDGDGR